MIVSSSLENSSLISVFLRRVSFFSRGGRRGRRGCLVFFSLLGQDDLPGIIEAFLSVFEG